MKDDKSVNLLSEAYRHSPESVTQMAELMYGDGAWEIVAKLSADEQRRNKTQARVALGTNVIGITAGGAALGTALHDYTKLADETPKVKRARNVPGILKPAYRGATRAGKFVRAHPKKLAAAALGLQAVNVAGDAIANRVLAREATKKVPVKKGLIRNIKNTVKNVESASGKADRVVDEAHEIGRKVNNLIPSRRATRIGAGVLVGATAAGQAGGSYIGSKRGVQAGLKKVAKSYSITWRGEISKRDDEKRQVFGWASIVERDGKPVVDYQDDMISVDVIEKAAYDYVLTSRKGGDMHRRNGAEPHHVSDLVESFLVTPEKKKAMGLPDDVPTGWWVGFQINDEDTWNLVKEGKRTEFSIHGSGRRNDKILED